MNTFSRFKCKLSCCKTCSYCAWAFTKERNKSWISRLLLERIQLKYMKSVSCVTQLSCIKPVTSVQTVASNLHVGARLQNFWQTLLDLGAGPTVVQILKGGYTLPFRIWLKLTRSPIKISCYANPHRNSYLLEALHQLIDKNAVELVQNQTSLGFFNWLFLFPKPNNKWRPILDLSNLKLVHCQSDWPQLPWNLLW